MVAGRGRGVHVKYNAPRHSTVVYLAFCICRSVVVPFSVVRVRHQALGDDAVLVLEGTGDGSRGGKRDEAGSGERRGE